MQYDRYIEPFGGSGAVLLGKETPDKFEVYNDYNKNLVNLFRCMRERPMAFIKELGFLTLNARDDFTVIKDFFKKEEFNDRFLSEEMELTKIMLPELRADELLELQQKSVQEYDLRRAVMFLKLLRYSYSSGGKSFACQPFSVATLFSLIDRLSKRMEYTIEFTVKGTNYNKTVKTNSKGEFTLSDLVPGTYTVTEKEDSRYEKQSPKTVKVESGKTASVSFKNTLRKGDLKIIKTSEDGIVSDIEFTVTGKDYSKTAKSDKNGEIILTDLVPGLYKVTEKTDPRYEDQEPKMVMVEADKTSTVKFKNILRTGDLKIIKTSEDGIVSDIEFTVTGKDYSKTAKSDKNGEIILTDLVPGLYKVTEKTDPRYEDQEPKMVMVEADKTSTVRFKNVLRTGGLRIIKTSDDGIVADIEFTVTGKNYSKTTKSDESGEILLRDLTPGTYTVTEKEDERYEAQVPRTVTVEADKTATVKFKNTLRKGGLKIIKTSDDGIVADIKFTVTGTNYSKTAKSDKNGEIHLPDLIPGTYTVTEKEDERYEAHAPKTVTVEADKTATVKFKNTLRTGGLKIIKTSDDGVVANIEFTVKGTNYNKTAKSNSKGEILLSDLVPGTYTVTEKEDSRYEKQSPKTVKVEADKTATVKFKNTLRKGGLKIIKTSDDGIVADIEFTVTGKNYSKTAKSDKSGEIYLADLIPGTYTVTEKVDERYEAQSPKTVTVEADKTATVKFKNILKKWSVKIVKKDSETGKAIPYAGAEFQLYYPNGKLVSMNGSDVFTTDDNGSITTPEPLPYGKKYYLVEIKAPYGYVLDSTPVYFDVTDESTTEEKGVMLIKTEKSNPPQMGRITVEKFGEIFVDVITPDDPPVIPTPPEEFIESDMLMMAKATFESIDNKSIIDEPKPTENNPITNEPEPAENDTAKTYQPVYSNQSRKSMQRSFQRQSSCQVWMQHPSVRMRIFTMRQRVY